MKKSFISLVAAAAIVGGALAIATTSNAGTISTKGGTNVTMYGFIRLYTHWNKNTVPSGLAAGVTTNPKVTWSGFDATETRLGLKFNSGNGISGKLETDFATNTGTLRIRHAYVKQALGNGAWVLVGQANGITRVGPTTSSSINWNIQPGELGVPREGQVQLGNRFGFNGGTLTAIGVLEDFGNRVQGGIARETLPGLGGKLLAKIKTGFGSPALLYGMLFGQSVKINNPTNPGTEKSETPYALKAGARIPISAVTLKTNFAYTKGLTKVIGVAVGGPNSYYKIGGSVKTASATEWNIEADVAAGKKVGFVFGYYDVNFNKAAVEATGTGTVNTVKKSASIIAQVNYKTSKVTKLALEWDHLKTQRYNSATGYYNNKGDEEFVSYTYKF